MVRGKQSLKKPNDSTINIKPNRAQRREAARRSKQSRIPDVWDLREDRLAPRKDTRVPVRDRFRAVRQKAAEEEMERLKGDRRKRGRLDGEGDESAEGEDGKGGGDQWVKVMAVKKQYGRLDEMKDMVEANMNVESIIVIIVICALGLLIGTLLRSA